MKGIFVSIIERFILIISFLVVGYDLSFWVLDHILSGESFITIHNQNKIIILNGPSCAGKSSIQKKLQQLLPDLYLRIGIDNLFDSVLPPAASTKDWPNSMVEKKITDVNITEIFPAGITTDLLNRIDKIFEQRTQNNELIRAGISIKGNHHNPPQFVLKIGSAGNRVICGMHRAIMAYAAAKNNLIVDYILYEQEWLRDLINVLSGYKVYFIAVKIPLEMLEVREKSRATSPVGHARSHYDVVYKPDIYDLEVSSEKHSPEEIANQIIEFINENPQPKAFEIIKKMFI